MKRTFLTQAAPVYEAPSIVELGTVEELTLTGCLFGKKWGGADGWAYGPVTISNCSS